VVSEAARKGFEFRPHPWFDVCLKLDSLGSGSGAGLRRYDQMNFFAQLPALLAVAVSGGVYIALNIHVARLLDRFGPIFWRSAVQPLGRRGQQQLRRLTTRRIWCAVAVQVFALISFWWVIASPQTLLSLTVGLTAYVLLIGAIDVSLMAQLPIVSRLWRDPAVRVLVLAGPILLLYPARGYAAMWVGQIVGIGASNAPAALVAATGLVLSLYAAFVLGLISLLFEAAMVLAPAVPLDWPRRWRSSGLLVLAVTSFLANLLATRAATELTSSRISAPLISAIAFEFDAATALPCKLDGREPELAKGGEPFLRALHLASSQEKAVLIQREPSLFRPFVLRDLKPEQAAEKRVRRVRVVDCYQTELKLEGLRE
jgi:hypothetical protein